MKNYFLLLLSLLLSFPLLAQSAEEAAIKKAIEDETHYFNQRDYDQWASLWVHSPNTYVSIAGPNENLEQKGWEEISQQVKEFMANNPNPVPDYQKKTDYKYLVDGSMAFVTFDEDGNYSTRVLQKTDNGWKTLEVSVVQTRAYEAQARAEAIKKLIDDAQGNWQLDPETIENRSANFETTGIGLKITPKKTGMVMEGYWEIITENGNARNEWGEIQFMFPNDTTQALVLCNWSYTDSPFMMISSGVFEVNENKTFEGKVTAVKAQNPYLKMIIDFKSINRIRLDFSLLNREGNEAFGFAYDLVKKGA